MIKTLMNIVEKIKNLGWGFLGIVMENKDISKLIKKLRSKLGLTQEQFAQKVVVTFPSINSCERGTLKPHLKNFWKWSRRMD
ncbi:MAG: helix-turn-helix transcriptional regulator [Elusimicrobiales bacterium]|nr:helix-turn-helix transcriptional regulator [Elusimicrobiales bacterium]